MCQNASPKRVDDNEQACQDAALYKNTCVCHASTSKYMYYRCQLYLCYIIHAVMFCLYLKQDVINRDFTRPLNYRHSP